MARTTPGPERNDTKDRARLHGFSCRVSRHSCQVATSSGEPASHTRATPIPAALSQLPAATRLPFGETAIALNPPKMPLAVLALRVSSSRPLTASQTLAVASILAVKIRLPSGEHATEVI